MTKNIQTDTNQVMALGGLFQALGLVKEVAHHGTAAPESFACCMRSIFILDPDNITDVYEDREHIHDGITIFCSQLGDCQDKRDMELTRYAIGVMTLENRLGKRPQLLNRIRQEICDIQPHDGDPASYRDPETIAALAGIYAETISGLTPRIIVQGQKGYLAIAENAAKVRALLLAGIRAAVLWRQCGGTRWGLLFRRRRLIQAARQLLAIA